MVGRGRMLVGFTPTSKIRSCEFEFRSWQGVFDTTYVIKFISDGGFSPATPVSSTTNSTAPNDIAEILLKVVLKAIIHNPVQDYIPEYISSVMLFSGHFDFPHLTYVLPKSERKRLQYINITISLVTVNFISS